MNCDLKIYVYNYMLKTFVYNYMFYNLGFSLIETSPLPY